MSIQIEHAGELALADVDLGKQFMDALIKHYPDHAWYVEANHESGHLTVQLLYRENGVTKKWRWGMLIHLTNLKGADEINQRAMRDGGELLERYRLARGRATEEGLQDLRTVQVDTGSFIQ